ncbi:MAG: LysR family transcriptional regulator [Clostridiales bacterium]|nr:LysR family transcriptional regulator [Clostridiales bacterium]
MEIRVLRYYLAVVREESITKAAEVLHITQPTLSRQLAQMEEETGVRLFERGTRKIRLTSEGMLLRRRAEEILELVDKTKQELKDQDEQIEGVISVGCGDLKAVQLLPELFRSFHEQYPSVTFDLYTATADHIRERMEQGLTDIGLLLEPISMEKFEFIRLPVREEWVAILPPDSPLAKKEAVTAADLKEMPLILPHRLNVKNEVANWFGEDFEKLHILFTSNLPSNSSIMVRSGLACSLSIQGSTEFWDNSIVSRPLSPPMTASSVLAWKRQQPFGPAASRFISFVKDTLRNSTHAF